MKNNLFTICGTTVEIDAPRPIRVGEESERFRLRSGLPQLRLTLEDRETLPESDWALAGTAGERSVWRQGSQVLRRTTDICRSIPHMEIEYDLERPETAAVRVRRDDWLWATGGKYLWPDAALNQLLLHQRSLWLHASYVVREGRGILFTAPSQVGKSTQAELWCKYRGADLINGDKAGISLRERPVAHGLPLSGTSGVSWNVSAPLQAVVVLSQAPVNTVRRLGPTEALPALIQNVFVDRLVPEEWSLALQLLLDLLEAVPVYALACTPDERAVKALEAVL